MHPRRALNDIAPDTSRYTALSHAPNPNGHGRSTRLDNSEALVYGSANTIPPHANTESQEGTIRQSISSQPLGCIQNDLSPCSANSPSSREDRRTAFPQAPEKTLPKNARRVGQFAIFPSTDKNADTPAFTGWSATSTGGQKHSSHADTVRPEPPPPTPLFRSGSQSFSAEHVNDEHERCST